MGACAYVEQIVTTISDLKLCDHFKKLVFQLKNLCFSFLKKKRGIYKILIRGTNKEVGQK